METVTSISAPVRTAAPSAQPGVVPELTDAPSQYIAHIVQDGETAELLARRYGVSLSTLISENVELRATDGAVFAGQVVYVPNLASPSTHTVRWGETLTSIAVDCHRDIADLRAFNRGQVGRRDLIYFGTQLVIPPLRPPIGRGSSNATLSQGPTLLATSSTATSGVILQSSTLKNTQSVTPSTSAATPPSSATPAPVQGAVPARATETPEPTPTLPPHTDDASPGRLVPLPQVSNIDVSGLSPSSFGVNLNPYTIRFLQRMLNRTGADIIVDGDIRGSTRNAIIDFQKRSGLIGQKGVAPGAIDPLTWAALCDATQKQVVLSGVTVNVTERDLQEPDVRAAFSLVGALVYDDPHCFRTLVQMDRAHTKDGIIIDRATLQAIADHVRSRGFRLKDDPVWTYNEAQSVANLVGNTLAVNRVYANWTYDGLIAAAVPDEIKKWLRDNPGYQMRPNFDVAAWVKACLSVESSFNPRERSPAGAAGIAQFMPGTAREVGLRDRYNVEASVRAMVRFVLRYAPNYSRRSDAEFPALLAAAYNAGPNGEARENIPRYVETQEHGRMLDALYNLYQATDEPRADAPLPPASALEASPPAAPRRATKYVRGAYRHAGYARYRHWYRR